MADDVQYPVRSKLWRTSIHEAGHVVCSRYQNIELAGSTIVEGPGYSGLTWGPGSQRALRGKAAYDSDDSAAHDAVAVAVRVADSISRSMAGPGEDRVTDIFSSTQAFTIDLMGGAAAEMVLLGNAPPKFMKSDLCSAHAIAGIVCHTPASIEAFCEHAFQEAMTIIGKKQAGRARPRACVD